MHFINLFLSRHATLCIICFAIVVGGGITIGFASPFIWRNEENETHYDRLQEAMHGKKNDGNK
jgi:hypothetical protein